MRQLHLRALGKVNLGLDVLGKRSDGYHEVCMVMQTVNVFDRVEITQTKTPGITIKTNLYYLPCNQNNLVYKAADLLIKEFGINYGVQINLDKHIPVAAGMAGGSSDAAAVLFGLNQLFRLGLTLKELQSRGLKLGADVPYCLMRGTALAEGIGEKLTRLPGNFQAPVLIAKPPVNISTATVYKALDLNSVKHPDMKALIKGIQAGDIYRIAAEMGNVLESVTIPRCPVINEIKMIMIEFGALNAIMSGSGPTVFGIFEDKKHAKAAAAKLRAKRLVRDLFITNFYQMKTEVQI